MFKFFKRTNTSKITVNGVTIEGDFEGKVVSIRNGTLTVDGQSIDLPDQKVINVTITGDVNEIDNDTGDVSVTGNVNVVGTKTGDVRVEGSVGGSVETKTGDVRCGAVTGNVRTTTGDIYKN
jgi:hypothetical protein